MTRTLFVVATVVATVAAPTGSAQQRADLIGTWTLAAMQEGVETGKPVAVRNARGLLVFDRSGSTGQGRLTGHVIEVVVTAPEALVAAGRGAAGGADAQARFRAFTGSWGTYRVNERDRQITLMSAGAVSPNVMGTEFSRSYELANDTLTMTSVPGELHTRGTTRWVWERVPNVEHLSDGYRQVIGFWEHVVEKRFTGADSAGVESRRAPSVIVYTPAGYVGVHFPPLSRARFAGPEPTDAEARAALAGYIGYFGALGVYPGMVFHHIMAGLSPATGTTLKRPYELKGAQLNIRFRPTYSQPGDQAATEVTLKRLSGEKEMLGR
jgi:hypothetical protein